MKEKIYVNFVVPTDEAIRLECQNGYNRSEKELFIVDEKFYFFYAMNRTNNTQTVSLREISKEEYLARKSELLNARPSNGAKEWSIGENKYALKTFRFGTWRRNMPADDCIFFTDNKVKDLKEAVVTQVAAHRNAERTLDRESKTEYARRCGSLAHALGIEFVNVLRIGPQKDKLIQFKLSYQRALTFAQALSLKEKRQLYDLLNANKKSRKEALDMLRVKYYDADVYTLNISELMNNLHESLNIYVEESVKKAIRNAAMMEKEDLSTIYTKLCERSRSVKREMLSALGVDVELIEFKHYPFERLKRAIGDLLGLKPCSSEPQ